MLKIGRLGGVKDRGGGVKLAMTEKGAAGCAMRREVKWRDGLWTGVGRTGDEFLSLCRSSPME